LKGLDVNVSNRAKMKLLYNKTLLDNSCTRLSFLSFPFLQTELEQHAKLHSDLETLTESLHKWQVDPETYDKERLRSILDDLSPNFREHLKKEVDHLSKDRLVEHISSQELKDCIAKLEEEAKKGDPFVDPVFMMSHTPPEHKVSGMTLGRAEATQFLFLTLRFSFSTVLVQYGMVHV